MIGGKKIEKNYLKYLKVVNKMAFLLLKE